MPQGYDLYLHPVAFAGWVGIIITMLNLMPVAVLDGGHISRSLFNKKSHYYVSIIGIIVTIILGWYFMAILMAFFLLFVYKSHPGAMDNVSKINGNRKIVAVLVLIIFILCLAPMPNII
jgi:membrane-associated protease RseP (regulator of RpoE activity)